MGKAETWSMATVRGGRKGRKVQTSCCHRFVKKSSEGEEKRGQRKKINIENRQIKMIKNSQGKGEKVRKRTEEEEARLHSNSSVLSSKRS